MASGAAIAFGVAGLQQRTLGGSQANGAAVTMARVATLPGITRSVGAHPTQAAEVAGATDEETGILPAGSVRFGAWSPGAPWDLAPVAALEQQLGRPLGLIMWYQGWGAGNAALDVPLLEKVSARSALPMITWEPWDYAKGVNQPDFRLSRIATGAFDDYVQSWAQGLKAWGKPVVLRFAHEMNNPRYPWSAGVNGNTAADFRAAWQRVRSIFDAAGTTNVAWHWCPNADWANSGQVSFADLYPGDSGVDFVGVDGYNGGTALPWGGWQSFPSVFEYSIEQLRSLTARPLIIGEVASAEQGGDKAGWVGDMLLNALPRAFPDVRAVVWFNESRETDWRIQSSQGSVDAFRTALKSSYYGAPAFDRR
jgi:hypothetical protein